jgi:EAL domain-containing protein (putative c-di-GMP-specific phosphodiesterase class I)/ActR/RegA family two-component response regulator
MAPQAAHILVAEDDDFQRSIIVDLLKNLGVSSIIEASNGQEALTHLHDNDRKINLVLSDLKMPEMDGMEFLRCLGQEHSDVEIVILSSLDKKLLATIDRISDIYNLNLLATIEKPIGLKQLKNILDKSGHQQVKKVVRQSNTPEFTLDEILEGIRLKQFAPYLQPKVDLKTGMIIGAEALARWIHPKHGVIPPYAFISKLEESKKIDDLTFLMLKECASMYAMFVEKDQNIHIAVNLSLVSLSDPKIAQRITSTIIENGGDPKHFTLEITESTAMTDAPVALENLARLSMNDFTLSVDDYGTGYSNLQQLTRIDFGELKIDRSLVHGFAKSEAMQIIVASNIEMAHKLKIKCVAEGIETAEDWEQLRKMGCDIGQGYFIEKPMNFVDFYNFIKKNQSQPLEKTPKNVHHFVKSKQQSNSDKKILVIEDDEFTRNVILKILINMGYQKTESVESAKAALKLFEKENFDLIFTDIFMSDMNGLDLIKQIRTNKTMAKPNTRIVVLSGLTQSKALGVAMALNVNDFIVKPLTPSIVEEKIEHIIASPCNTQNPIAYETINTAI